MTIKANELKQGDKITVEIYSTLWNKMVSAPAVVMDVTEIDGGFHITVKARDGFKEMIVNRFAKAGTEYAAA